MFPLPELLGTGTEFPSVASCSETYPAGDSDGRGKHRETHRLASGQSQTGGEKMTYVNEVAQAVFLIAVHLKRIYRH